MIYSLLTLVSTVSATGTFGGTLLYPSTVSVGFGGVGGGFNSGLNSGFGGYGYPTTRVVGSPIGTANFGYPATRAIGSPINVAGFGYPSTVYTASLPTVTAGQFYPSLAPAPAPVASTKPDWLVQWEQSQGAADPDPDPAAAPAASPTQPEWLTTWLASQDLADPAPGASSDSTWASVEAASSPSFASSGVSSLFDQNVIRKYNIEITAADAKTLNNNAWKEQYVPCTLTTNYGSDEAVTITGAGCKYKGAVGSLLHCFDEKTGKMKTGQQACKKLSIKVDANKFGGVQQIDGMKRLQFHGMGADNSLVSERTMYNLLDKVGIRGPAATHGELHVNGKFEGLFAVIQEYNTAFTQQEFGTDFNAGNGALYKELWWLDEHVNDKWLNAHLRSGNADNEFIKQIWAEMKQTPETKEAASAFLDKYFDVESIVQTTAFNDRIGLTDDWRFRHNNFFYVRNDADGKKLVYLPWDYDRVYEDANGGLEFRRNMVANWFDTKANPNSYDCRNSNDDASVQGLSRARGIEKQILQRKKENLPPFPQRPIECDKFTRLFSLAAYDTVKERFKQYQQQLPANVVDAQIDQYASQIKSLVQKDPDYQVNSWSSYIRKLKQFLKDAPAAAPAKGSSFGGSSFGGLSSFGGNSFGGLSSFGGGLSSFGGGLSSFGGGLSSFGGGFGGMRFGR